MKIVALGDIHGYNTWRQIVANESDADKIIFVGDYFDSRNPAISGITQMENFKDIMAFKKAHPHKVVLLFGNHDFHYPYFSCCKNPYDGFQAIFQHDISELINQALIKNLLQMCFSSGRFLFTHAGVTKTWSSENGIDHFGKYVSLPQIAAQINQLFKYQPCRFGFTPGKLYDKEGDETCQTPIWVRPKSLTMDRIDHWIQVVGHTVQDKIAIADDLAHGTIFIDTLGTSGEYLVIENNIPYAKK